MQSNHHLHLFKVASIFSCTHPCPQEGQSWNDPLLGDALEDPGCTVQAPHAGSQRGDVEAQQKEETDQGDLEEEGKQTESGSGWAGLGAHNTYTQFSSADQGLVKTEPGRWLFPSGLLRPGSHAVTGVSYTLCGGAAQGGNEPQLQSARISPQQESLIRRQTQARSKRFTLLTLTLTLVPGLRTICP